MRKRCAGGVRPSVTAVVLRALAAVVTMTASSLASAATYRVPTDDLLIGKAGVILRGVVTDVRSQADAEGAIHTDIAVSVSRVLKGSSVAPIVTVRQPGGTVGDDTEVYPGIGAFTRNEEVLLMLDPRADGTYRLTDFALGKFHVGRAADGSEFLRRDGLTDAHVLGPAPMATMSLAPQAGSGYVEPDRDAAGFEQFIADTVAGRASAGGYTLSSYQIESGASIDFVFLTDPNDPLMTPSRLNQFDTEGKIVYRDNATGDPGSKCVSGCHPQVAAGVADWNGTPGAQILVAYGGTDATVGKKCLGALRNQIQFNDPCSELPPFDVGSCTGTLAVGGFASSSTGGKSVTCAPLAETINFKRITRGAVVVNTGVGDCEDACDYEDMIAHETGHTLGAGHSPISSALMNAFLSKGRCGVPQPDDVSLAQCAYPCRPAALTSVTPRITSGILRAVAIGTGFRGGATVEIDSGSGFVAAPKTAFISRTKVVGRDVAAIWPAGVPVKIRAVNKAGCPSNAVTVTR